MNYPHTALLILSGFFLVACEPSGEMSGSDESAAEAGAENGSAEAMSDAAELEAATPIAQTTTQASLLSEPEWAILFAGSRLDFPSTLSVTPCGTSSTTMWKPTAT